MARYIAIALFRLPVVSYKVSNNVPLKRLDVKGWGEGGLVASDRILKEGVRSYLTCNAGGGGGVTSLKSLLCSFKTPPPFPGDSCTVPNMRNHLDLKKLGAQGGPG